jgi:type II secretory pathway pseudopilin PulG
MRKDSLIAGSGSCGLPCFHRENRGFRRRLSKMAPTCRFSPNLSEEATANPENGHADENCLALFKPAERRPFIIHHSPLINPRRGYTLVELFLTLGVLAIVLGLMINMANRVRREATDQLTRKVLDRLTVLMVQYQKQNGDSPPPVQPLVEGRKLLSEPALAVLARQNNADFVRYLHLTGVAKESPAGDDPLTGSFGRSSADAGVLEDPWGSPIVFMARQNPAIGMAPGDAFFFFSAGPDRQFLTREDNVYSYEGSIGNAER